MSRPKYRIKCLKDEKIFDSIDELCKYYKMTYDQVAYRLDKVKDYKDGMNFVRIVDNTEALQSVKAVDSRKFVEKYGDKTVPLPGYEDRYTISTSGVITDIKRYNRVIPVKTVITKKQNVILNKGGTTMQTHSIINLMKKAFGDPESEE